MAVTDLTMLSALKSKMRWHQSRQRVIAENIANADTPGYAAKDLKPLQFKSLLAQPQQVRGAAPSVMPVKTSASHLAGLPMPKRAEGEVKRVDFEVTPQGNGVVLEDQMIKLADNQMEYEAAANLYQRGLSLLRTAISRR